MGKHFVRLGERTDALYTIADIRKRNADAGLHFFDADTMRFFRSRVCSDVFQCADGSALFVTSEQGPAGPRLYTIRRVERSGHVVENMGEGFQGYKTRHAALAAARRIAAEVTMGPKCDYCDDGVFCEGEPYNCGHCGRDVSSAVTP